LEHQTEFELPASIPVPATNPSCGCTEHFEKKELEVTLPIPAKKLFHILFQQGQVFDRYHQKRGESQRNTGEWLEPPPAGSLLQGEPANALASRDVKFVMPINNPMGKVETCD
jgi:hypothetical protein